MPSNGAQSTAAVSSLRWTQSAGVTNDTQPGSVVKPRLHRRRHDSRRRDPSTSGGKRSNLLLCARPPEPCRLPPPAARRRELVPASCAGLDVRPRLSHPLSSPSLPRVSPAHIDPDAATRGQPSNELSASPDRSLRDGRGRRLLPPSCPSQTQIRANCSPRLATTPSWQYLRLGIETCMSLLVRRGLPAGEARALRFRSTVFADACDKHPPHRR